MNDFPHRNPLITGILLSVLLFIFLLFSVAIFFLPETAKTLNIGAAPDRSWTPPPTNAPSPTPTISPTPRSPIPTIAATSPLPTPLSGGHWTFKPGDVAFNVNNGPVNLRKSPGYKGKPAGDRIALVPANSQVIIITGPARADGLLWWYVAWNGKQGWMAENRASGAPLLAPID